MADETAPGEIVDPEPEPEPETPAGGEPVVGPPEDAEWPDLDVEASEPVTGATAVEAEEGGSE
jgi:hypothetical protein